MDRRSDQCASSFFSMFSLVCYEYVPKSQKILLLTILRNNETKNNKNDITQENVKNDWVKLKQYLFATGQYTVLENQLVTFVKPGRIWFLWYELNTLNSYSKPNFASAKNQLNTCKSLFPANRMFHQRQVILAIAQYQVAISALNLLIY